MLEINGLHRGFGTGTNRVEVLKGIDLEMKKGELVALMGPSGCGKSTLLNIIGGLLAAEKGNIRLEERDYGLKGPSAVVDVRRHKVGWIFQDFHLLEHLSALDNVTMALEISGMPSSEAEKKAKKALVRVGLGDRMHHRPNELSGGQRQRVAIARALVNEPSIILADEPTGNLDSKSGHEIMKIFDELHRSGNTIILVTHEDEIAKYSNRIVRLLDGKVVSDASVKK